MSEIMIPRHDMLTKPRLYGLEVVVRSGTYPQCSSQSSPVPLPGSALPIVIRDDVGRDIELFRHVVEGHGRNISARRRKVACELEKLE
jgi:hypothetical protein